MLECLLKLWKKFWKQFRIFSGYLSEREADGVIVLNWYHKQFDEAACDRYFERNPQHLLSTHSSIADYYLGTWAGVEKSFVYTENQRQRFAITDREGFADRKVPPQPNFYTLKDGKTRRYNLRKLAELPHHLLKAERFSISKKNKFQKISKNFNNFFFGCFYFLSKNSKNFWLKIFAKF